MQSSSRQPTQSSDSWATRSLPIGRRSAARSAELQFTGQELTDGGWSYYELSPGQTLGLYTSTGWQFWVNGRKVGWFDSADGMLHTVSQVVEEEIRIGDWVISAVGGYGIKYTG